MEGGCFGGGGGGRVGSYGGRDDGSHVFRFRGDILSFLVLDQICQWSLWFILGVIFIHPSHPDLCDILPHRVYAGCN
ncbi:hypothetical protein Hanom_Chr09g00773861 [Helianthus anomalus]